MISMEEELGALEEKFLPDNHKKALIALLGVVIVVAAGLVLMNGASPADTPSEDDTAPADETDNSTTDSIGLTASQIEGEITDVTITDIKAEPASPRITPKDGIRFVNQAGVDVEFSFDREFEDFQLAAGDSIIIDPTMIIYYDATPVKEGVEFRDISARINVQPK